MGRRYSLLASGYTVGTNKTLLSVNQPSSATSTRPKIYDVVIGSNATPADQATQFDFLRLTAAGTSTATSGNALDPGDPASLLAVATGTQTAYTAEPTYTASSTLLRMTLNQRATFRWVAAPMSELIVPNTASNGIGLRSIASTGTPTYDATVLWEE